MARLVSLVAVLGVLLAACTGRSVPSAVADGKVLVVASIEPLADFVRQVGGEHVRVVALVAAGASPHTYEPTPSQVAQVEKADLLVLNGVGLEFWADKLARGTGNADLVVVDTSAGVEILDDGGHDEGPAAGEEEHGLAGNPHIWLDPLNAIVQVQHVRDALIRVDPAHGDDYRANAERYISQLRALDEEIAREVATWRHREFIGFHAAWVYFASRYGLVQVAAIEESPGREPSAADVARIVETARRLGAKAVFAEPQFSPKAAETIAAESGADVLFLDPLGSSLAEPTYVGLMRYNLQQMAKALR